MNQSSVRFSLLDHTVQSFVNLLVSNLAVPFMLQSSSYPLDHDVPTTKVCISFTFWRLLFETLSNPSQIYESHASSPRICVSTPVMWNLSSRVNEVWVNAVSATHCHQAQRSPVESSLEPSLKLQSV